MAEAQATKVVLTSPGLGEVELFGFEIPESLPLGGVQKLTVTEFLGRNKRAVHALGAQPRPLEWEGKFLTESALPRAMMIDTMRLRGEILDLTWGEFKCKVVISEYLFDIKHAWMIEYSIAMEILQPTEEKDNLTVVESLDNPQLGILGLMEKIQDAFLILQRAVSIGQAIARGDINAIGGALANMVGILGTVGNYVPALNFEQFRALATSATAIATTAAALAQKLERIVGPIGLGSPIAESLSISSSATVLASLIARYTTPVPVRAVTTISTNVFRAAVEQYGDLDRWSDIADTNNINRVVVTGARNIQLPAYRGRTPRGARNTDVYEIPNSNIPLPRGN